MQSDLGSTLASSTNRRGFLRLSAVAAAALGTASLLSSCAPATASSTVLRVGSTTDIDSLNPFTAFSTQAEDVLQLVYDKLVEYDASLKVVPSLASKSEESPDGKTFTYTLRSGAKWHDGKPVTADDIVFTFEMVRDNQYGTDGAYFSQLTSVKALSTTQVELVYSVPQTVNPGVIMPMVPKHIWGPLSKKQLTTFPNSAPVGSGPYTFTSWKKGSLVTVTRNDDWWGPKPAASKVTWAVFGSDDVVAQSLKSGTIDLVSEVPPTIYTNLKGANDVRRITMNSFSFHMIGFNCSTKKGSKGSPLLKDVAVRQALSCAVSRKQLVELALGGYGVPATDLLPPAFGDYAYTPAPADVLDNDPAKANALLDAAGYTTRGSDGIRKSKSGTPLTFRILAIADTTVDVKAGELMVTAAKAVGIGLTLSTTDADTMGSTVFNTDAPDWDVMVWGWDSGLADPSYLLGIPTTAQIGGNNDTFWTDATYDSLYDQQAQTVDHAARLAIVQRMQAIHYAACPYIVMWYQDKLAGVRTDTWTGWKPVNGGLALNFTRANYVDVKPA